MTKAAENIVSDILAHLNSRSTFERAWSSYDSEGQATIKQCLVDIVDKFLPEGIPLTCQDAVAMAKAEEVTESLDAPFQDLAEEAEKKTEESNSSVAVDSGEEQKPSEASSQNTQE